MHWLVWRLARSNKLQQTCKLARHLPTALLASAGLYGLYVVPLSTVLSGSTGGSGSALLLLYECLGAFLAYLYQRSGGSLPLVVVTH